MDRPKKRAVLAPPPPDDEPADDPLTTGAPDAADWRAHPQTRLMVSTLVKRYVGLTKALVQAAPGSSDPRVSARGLQIQELTTVIITMGGKV